METITTTEACVEIASYCSASMLTAALWITYGPAAAAAETAFGWHNREVALLSVWGPALGLLASPAAPRLVRRLGGPRNATTAVVALCAGAAALRCAPGRGLPRLLLAHASCALNGVGGVLILSTPAMVARDALAEPRRHLGTSTMLAANSLGGGLGFVAAAAAKDDVEGLLVYECAAALAILALVAARRGVFRRDAPDGGADAPLPAFGPLLKSRSYVLLAAGCGMTMGAFTGWLGVLTPLLESSGWAPRDANAVGVACCFAAAAAQVLSGALSTRRKRLAILACNGAALAALLAFAVVAQAAPRRSPAALALALVAAFGVVAPEGAIYELATAPAPAPLEASAGAGLVFAFNLPMATFILLDAVASPRQLLWILVASNALGLGLLAVEAATADDRPIFLPDARPLNAEEEYRPLDAAAEPGILNNFPPWLPPPVRKSRRLPFSCGRSAA